MTAKDGDTTDESGGTRPTIVSPGDRGGDGSDDGTVLSEVETVETIADRVDLGRIDRELPEGWTVGPDLIATDEEPLAETLLFRRSRSGPRVVLKPAVPSRPGEDIEIYERRDPLTATERRRTVDRLREAIRIAIDRAYRRDG
jgi:hypothetical protein